MSALKRREIWIAITALSGLIVIFDQFFVLQITRDLTGLIQGWAVTIAGLAVGLGLINLGIIHTRCLAKRAPNWYLSLWLLFIMILTIAIGLSMSTNSPQYSWLFQYVYAVVGATMWSLLGFYLASASFRALRARTLEAGLLILSATLLMLSQAPVGSLIPYLPEASNWIRNVVNTASQRGIMMATAVGAIGLGIRTLLGRERGYAKQESTGG